MRDLALNKEMADGRMVSACGHFAHLWYQWVSCRSWDKQKVTNVSVPVRALALPTLITRTQQCNLCCIEVEIGRAVLTTPTDLTEQ